MTAPARAGVASPDGGAPLAQRLAAVEAGIRDDRHRNLRIFAMELKE